MNEEPEQGTMFDLSAKEMNPYWIDPAQPLLIPVQPLHWKAHRLQLLLGILDKQALKNPAQFNSKNYIDTLNEYTRVVTLINEGKSVDPEGQNNDGTNDKTTMGENGRSGEPEAMGNAASSGVDIGISADNPFAR